MIAPCNSQNKVIKEAQFVIESFGHVHYCFLYDLKKKKKKKKKERKGKEKKKEKQNKTNNYNNNNYKDGNNRNNNISQQFGVPSRVTKSLGHYEVYVSVSIKIVTNNVWKLR